MMGDYEEMVQRKGEGILRQNAEDFPHCCHFGRVTIRQEGVMLRFRHFAYNF